MCGGDGTAMCGEPRVTAKCTCTEREFGRCSRPTVRPGRTVHDERDHGDGSDTRPRVVVEDPPSRSRHRRQLGGGALGPPGAPGSVFETYMNASKSGQLSRKGSMCVSRSAVWKESARLGRRPPWRSR